MLLPKCCRTDHQEEEEADDLSSEKRNHSADERRSPMRENSPSSSSHEDGIKRAEKNDQVQQSDAQRQEYWRRLLALNYWVKIDGCFRKPEKGGGYRGYGGYGAIVCDNNGKEIVAAAGVSERPVSHLYHKLQGVKLGLKLAKEYGCSVVEVSINSMYAVNIASMPYDPTMVPPYVRPIMEEIKQMSYEFKFLHINYLFKDQNRAADYLASLGETIKFEPHEFPEELRKIVDDAANEG
ncbi:hypothetical protein BVC80_1679g2 [Macleaya cordata]|uniref:RNase H type-1 domain-containing protein n=1 Tax=Macleaya cordata TaxID=56857 RepID=A0A200Q0R4_MACCD|nr:hypothetical protein BVC80_1679g2 [Macleaya cordata]